MLSLQNGRDLIAEQYYATFTETRKIREKYFITCEEENEIRPFRLYK